MATAAFPSHYRSQFGPPQPQPNLPMVSFSIIIWLVMSNYCSLVSSSPNNFEYLATYSRFKADQIL